MKNKSQRRFDEYNKYKKRIKERIGWFDHYQQDMPRTWKELQGKWWSKHLKDTPTPCSCEVCVGERYDRQQTKKLDNRLIKEQLKEWDERYDDPNEVDLWDECYYWDSYYKNAS